jgi:hypothetical protein
VKLIVALLGLLSLLGMQAHTLTPHHHHDPYFGGHFHAGLHTHAGDRHDSPMGEVADNHWHHHKIAHADDATTKPPRAAPFDAQPVAALPEPPSEITPAAHARGVRAAHPFVPFSTGPPGTFQSRAPPAA